VDDLVALFGGVGRVRRLDDDFFSVGVDVAVNFEDGEGLALALYLRFVRFLNDEEAGNLIDDFL
jgi:hypothetical protein